MLFVCYIVVSGIIVVRAVLSLPLPPLTTIIVSVEQVCDSGRLNCDCLTLVLFAVVEVVHESIFICS
jgi:hypothetical protein